MRRLARAGGLKVRVARVPGGVLTLAGAGGSFLHRVGLSGVAMTRDKARELLARHWCARTDDSMRALGLPAAITFDDGARMTWAWYRESGWIR